jgi:hypothetical protein
VPHGHAANEHRWKPNLKNLQVHIKIPHAAEENQFNFGERHTIYIKILTQKGPLDMVASVKNEFLSCFSQTIVCLRLRAAIEPWLPFAETSQ